MASANLIAIPFRLDNENILQPQYLGEFSGKYVFNIFSPIDGSELNPNDEYLVTHVLITIPFGVDCSLKHLSFRDESNKLIRDTNINAGLLSLRGGRQYRLKVRIDKELDKLTIKRGQTIAQLVFNNPVELVRFWSAVTLNNIVRYQRLAPIAEKPVQISDSAGIDLASAHRYMVLPNEVIEVHTCLAFAIPIGFCGRLVGRSGLAKNHNINVLAGGEVVVYLINHGKRPFTVEQGDRIAQMIITQCSSCVLVECELSRTSRGSKGFGSTGIKSISPAKKEKIRKKMNKPSLNDPFLNQTEKSKDNAIGMNLDFSDFPLFDPIEIESNILSEQVFGDELFN